MKKHKISHELDTTPSVGTYGETGISKKLDKSTWGEGAWNDEPDELQWIDDATGYECEALRNTEYGGFWCGYVGVPKEHPYYGKSDDEINFSHDSIDIHGGLTFSGRDKDSGIWFFGFDCARYDDYLPDIIRYRNIMKEGAMYTYRTLDFVKAECAKLAKQLKEKK